MKTTGAESKTDRGQVEEEKRIRLAQKDFNESWKEIEPFVKKRSTKRLTTAGHWNVSGHDPEITETIRKRT